MRQRITVTRLVLTGVFAFAWKKRTKGSVLVTILTLDGPLVFERPTATKTEVMSDLARQRADIHRRHAERTAPEDSDSGPVGSSPKGRLKALDEMMAEGLLSEDEYNHKRRQILDEL